MVELPSNKKTPKVSVIVPIYNVEKYIERCARALFEQSLDDIEYIFVNDCTQDNSMQVLNKVVECYPQRANWVIITNTPVNIGLPKARKYGLQFISGEYIIHCDSDDWPERNMYEILYSKAVDGDFDIICCNYYRTDGVVKRQINSPRNRLLTGPIWNKMIKRHICEMPIIFPTNNKGEDGAYMVQYSFYAKKIAYVDLALHNYYVNPNSMCMIDTLENCINKMNQEVNNVNLIIEFLKFNNALHKYHSFIMCLKYGVRKNLYPFINDPIIYKKWRSCYPELDNKYCVFPHLNMKNRLLYLVIRLRLTKLLGFRFSYYMSSRKRV